MHKDIDLCNSTRRADQEECIHVYDIHGARGEFIINGCDFM